MTYILKIRFFHFSAKKSPKMYLKKKFHIFQKYYVIVSYSSPACQFSAKSLQKQRNDTPSNIQGLDRFRAFSPVRIFKAVAWQSCSQAIYPKIWENLLIYYLGKVKKFEKHRMIESILKNVISENFLIWRILVDLLYKNPPEISKRNNINQ